MALGRRTGARFQGSIWPGFVDAMTALLLVLMFVLSIFMIVQFVLRETISGQDEELDALSAQLIDLADALGLERRRTAELEGDVGQLTASLTTALDQGAAQAALIDSLTAQITAGEAERAALGARITDFEAQVARLLTERDAALGQGAALAAEVDSLRAEQADLMSERERLNLALAAARSEIDAGVEAARLDAARREALEALIADLRARGAAQDVEAARLSAALTETEAQLSQEEAARLAEAAAAQALRDRLANADEELTAMTLALEAERKRAEDTLTLLAAAEAARTDLNDRLAQAILAREATEANIAALEASAGDAETLRADLAAALAAKLAAEEAAQLALTEAEARDVLLSAANARLSEQETASAEDARRLALLNEQVAALRTQLGSLEAVLYEASERDADAQVQIEALGNRLNAALAQVASEQRQRAALEEAERIRLEAEAAALKESAAELERYRSDFFGRLRALLEDREGVRVVGDRFAFSSEVLFQPASADLAPEGQSQIASVGQLLLELSAEIPPEIDWILRVDGHTDNVPLTGTGLYRDNWELSQARALSVVRFLTDRLDFPPNRLAATGFGEYQPVTTGSTPADLAQNRRIELKLTER